MTVRLLVGDARERLREIPDGSVDLACCSPPFLALRKYGDNDAEMGSEGTPADFLDALLELTLEFRRVLAPHGSIAIELGDTYSGSGGAGGDYGDDGLRAGQAKFRQHNLYTGSRATTDGEYHGGNKPTTLIPMNGGNGWPLAKSLALIPQLYPASLAYGRNLLRSDVPFHRFEPWRVRNIITWCRPNPPVGALGDKVRPATSYITVACPSAKRYFDLDAVRTEPSGVNYGRQEGWNNVTPDDPTKRNRDGEYRPYGHPAGAPPLDWWDDTLNPDDPTDHMTIVMPTQPYPGAHYATWPAKLAQRLIDMMCPRQVCTMCGRPSERIVDITRPITADDSQRVKNANGQRPHAGRQDRAPEVGWQMEHTTLGWSDCGHNNWRPGHVLDPFAGSGTTLAVASGMGRDVTGIELYPANADLIRDRVGMFLEEIA